ncbi:MAG: ATPase [Methanobrevibacter sp.]|jgi:predicted PP-loop superfamily ATPase|nr:ATPase [Candidatus Methanovirga procula]
MKYSKSLLTNEIDRIRKEIGHDEVKIFIKQILFDDNTNTIWIITEDRGSKSAIIGKGGWVVGRLREDLNIKKIHVESHSDFILKKYQIELSLRKVDSFIKIMNIQIKKTLVKCDSENLTNSNHNNKVEPNDNNEAKFDDDNNVLMKIDDTIVNKDLTGILNLKKLLESRINQIYNFNMEKYLNKELLSIHGINIKDKNENNNYENNGNRLKKDNINRYKENTDGINWNNINEDRINGNSVNCDSLNEHELHNPELKHQSVVALSGGVDSSFSLILAKYLGFTPIAVTIDPGTIILPKVFKNNIDNLIKNLGVEHHYLKRDYSSIIEDSFNGKFHPCGRCSSMTGKNIFEFAYKKGVNLVIFGDLLSTGCQCLTENKIRFNNSEEITMFRLNLPATLSIGKEEIREFTSKFHVKKIKGFGCPLLHEAHKKYHHIKKFSIQRILRETRSGALEPGEALEQIWSFYKT